MSTTLRRGLLLLSTVVLIAVAVLLWTQQCTGPRPRVISTQIQEPSSVGDPFIVRAVVENRGRGEGHVSVDFKLKSADGEQYEATKTVSLDGHERVSVGQQVFAPQGPKYQLSARVHYPVQ